MIKKIITFTLFLILISINKNIFAMENQKLCPIEEKTPNVLSNYIKNLRTIEKNMLDSLENLKMKNYD
jgi:predicted nucleotide-binding protein (sugar kinase/HSP70/actin superfamily)